MAPVEKGVPAFLSQARKAKAGPATSASRKHWNMVRDEAGIKFDSWDAALQIVEQGWRGELARARRSNQQPALFPALRPSSRRPSGLSADARPGGSFSCAGELAREVKRLVEKQQPDSIAAKCILMTIVYFAALFVFLPWPGRVMLPWGPGFAVLITWLSSTVGGKLLQQMKMPGLLGNLLAGIVLKNAIPDGDVYTKSVRGLPDYWSSDIITFGLTIIFLRGGLEIDLELVKKAGTAALRLTVLPGVTEALVVAGLAAAIFGMEVKLGLSLGFILAAVSPAVVVGAMFELKKQGYGVAQNIPTLVVAAASFDDVVAISGFAITIAFAIPSKDSTTTSTLLHAFHGPVTVGLGILLGLLCGNLAACTKLWDKPWKRVAVVAGQGLLLSFGAKRLEQEWEVDHAHPIGASAGILGALCMAGVTSYMWERGKGYHSSGADKNFAHDTEASLASLWATLAQPLLFGVVGSYLDFRKMRGETIGKAIGVVLLGVLCRTAGAYLATWKTHLKPKERLFVALAWLPKATVQAAFASYPLTKILDKSARGEWADAATQAQYEQWGQDILTTGVLAILITAPAGLIIIQRLGPRWLEQDVRRSMETSIKDMVTLEVQAGSTKVARRPGQVAPAPFGATITTPSKAYQRSARTATAPAADEPAAGDGACTTQTSYTPIAPIDLSAADAPAKGAAEDSVETLP